VLQTAPAALAVLAAYPAVFPLAAFGWGGPGEPPQPATVPASARYLDPASAYLVDAGHVAFLWLGAHAPHGLVKARLAPRAPAVNLPSASGAGLICTSDSLRGHLHCVHKNVLCRSSSART
jgi:hypothetical protein